MLYIIKNSVIFNSTSIILTLVKPGSTSTIEGVITNDLLKSIMTGVNFINIDFSKNPSLLNQLINRRVEVTLGSLLSRNRYQIKSIQPYTQKGPTPDLSSPDQPIPLQEEVDNDLWPDPEIPCPFTPLNTSFLSTGEGFSIGYAVVPHNPEFFTDTRSTYVEESSTLRSSDTIKKNIGTSYQTYSINYSVSGVDEIQNGLVEVLEQALINPFLVVDGQPFNHLFGRGPIPTNEIALKNITVSTRPRYPNTLDVAMQFDPFIWDYAKSVGTGRFTKYTLADSYCFPLYKLWCKSVGKSKYRNRPQDGGFIIGYPNPLFTSFITSAVRETNKFSASQRYLGDALKLLLDGKEQNLTPDIKEFAVETTGKVFVIKARSDEMFSLLTGLVRKGDGWALTKKPSNVIGFVLSEKHNLVFADSFGQPISLTNKTVPEQQSFNTLLSFKTGNLSSLVDFTYDHQINGAVLNYLIEFYKNQLRNVYTEPDLTTNATIKANEVYESFLINLPDKVSIVVSGTNEELYKLANTLSKVGELVDPSFTFSDSIYDLTSTREKLKSLVEVSLDLSQQPSGGKEPDIIIEQITGSKSHNLAVKSTRSIPLPIHEFLGSYGTNFIVTGMCLSDFAKSKLDKMKDEFDKKCLSNASFGSGQGTKLGTFMYVQNEIFDLFGVNFVMPVTLTYESIPNYPDHYRFTLTLMEYDPRIRDSEKLDLLSTYRQQQQSIINTSNIQDQNTHPTVEKALDWFSLQGALSYVEVYPDLYLPTKEQVNEWIKFLKLRAQSYLAGSTKLNSPITYDKKLYDWTNEFFQDNNGKLNASLISEWDTESNYFKGYFCDPDFYIYYDYKNSFHYSLDRVAEKIFGKRNSKLEGTPGSQKFVSPLRFTDEEWGLITIMPPEHLAANEEQAGKFFEDLRENTFTNKDLGLSEEGVTAAEIFKLEDEVAQEMKQKGGAKGWWYIGQDINDVANYRFLTITEEELYRPIDELVNPNNPNQDNDDISNLPQELRNFYQVAWRISQAKKVATQGRSITNSNLVEDFNPGDTFMLPVPRVESLIGIQEPIRDLIRTFSIDTEYEFLLSIAKNSRVLNSNSLDELSSRFANYSNAKISQSFSSQAVGDLVDGINLSGPNTILNILFKVVQSPKYATESFLSRTALVNSWYESGVIGSKTGYEKICGPEIAPILSDVYRTAKTYNIDPNLILAYITIRLRRSESFNPVRRTNRFFLSEKYSSVNQLGSLVRLFASTFRKYRDTSFSNEEALLKTDLDLVHNKAINESGNIKDLIRKFHPQPSVMDSYYAAYIEYSRAFGVFFLNESQSSDILGPYNPLIYIDFRVERREQKTPGFSTDYSLSGANVLIRGDRRSTGENIAQEFLENDAQLSPEEQASQYAKVKFALFPETESMVWGMLYDMRSYTPIGKILSAYPTYQVVIINEGFYWLGGANKLWDQYYHRSMISDLEIFKSKYQPTHVATVTFSNMFFMLTRHTAQEAFLQNMALEEKERVYTAFKRPLESLNKLWTELILRNPTEELKEIWARNYLNLFVLSPGARIHIRMGYGSDASKLPVVFNGTIVETPAGATSVTVVALSDGNELEKPSVNKLENTSQGWFYKDGGMVFGSPKSPANIVTESLINLDGPERILVKLTDQLVPRDWSHGISHFGDVYFEGLIHHPAEVQLNIYDPSPTRLEQSVPAIKNFFEATSLYNWGVGDGRTWFSVQVSQPTPWKVAQVCANGCLDFIASAQPIMTNSTLFFGKWWYPFNFAWKASILDDFNAAREQNPTVYQNTESSVDQALLKLNNPFRPLFGLTQLALPAPAPSSINPQLINEYNKVDKLVTHMYSKPYTQIHIVNSAFNLLDNSITADSSLVFTDASGIYNYNGWLSSDAVEKTANFCIDDDIQPTERKTMMVDTGMHVSALQAGPGNIVRRVGDIFTGFVRSILGTNETVGKVPPTPAVSNAIVNALKESVKEMYQGSLTIIGTPSIKERDMIIFHDTHRNMKGPLMVKEVIHRFDQQTGFITIIAPDAVSIPRTSVQGERLIHTMAHFATYFAASYTFKIIGAGIKAIFRPGTTINSDFINTLSRVEKTLIKDRILESEGIQKIIKDPGLSKNDKKQRIIDALRKDEFNFLDNSVDEDLETLIKIVDNISNSPIEIISEEKKFLEVFLSSLRRSTRGPLDSATVVGTTLLEKLRARDLAGTPTTGARIKGVFERIKAAGLRQGLINELRPVREGIKTTDALRNTVQKGVNIGEDLWDTVKHARALTGANPITLLTQLTIMCATSSTIDQINHFFANRQVLKVYPIWSKGVPFIAGIRGRQGLVVGDTPGLLDTILLEFSQGESDIFPPAVTSAALAFLAFNGVEIDQNLYTSEADIGYLQNILSPEEYKNLSLKNRFIEDD